MYNGANVGAGGDARENGVIFDGSFEGLLTVVHKYYYEKLRPCGVYGEPGFQQTLGAEYVTVDTDAEKAAKVLAAINEKLSWDTQNNIYMALLSWEPDRFYAVFRYIVLAFKYPADVDKYEQLDFVLRVHKLTRHAGHEAQLMKGFTRFRKTAGDIFYADISPKNNLMPVLCQHFQDRLGGQKWVIHDVKRNIAGVYNLSEWVIVETPTNFRPDPADESDGGDYQELWKAFYNTIGIKERVNSKLRRQLMPKYFWEHMTEHKSTEFK